jgi:hypothetical protein
VAGSVAGSERSCRHSQQQHTTEPSPTFGVKMFSTPTIVLYSVRRYDQARQILTDHPRFLAIDEAKATAATMPGKWARTKLIVDTVSIVAEPRADFDMPEPTPSKLAALYSMHWTVVRPTEEKLDISPLTMTSVLLGVLDGERDGQTATYPGTWRLTKELGRLLKDIRNTELEENKVLTRLILFVQRVINTVSNVSYHDTPAPAVSGSVTVTDPAKQQQQQQQQQPLQQQQEEPRQQQQPQPPSPHPQWERYEERTSRSRCQVTSGDVPHTASTKTCHTLRATTSPTARPPAPRPRSIG